MDKNYIISNFKKYLNLSLLFILFSPLPSLAENTDYWSKNKTMNMPVGLGTTPCYYYNGLDENEDQMAIINEMYKQWMIGWVSSFAMYGDWQLRNIGDNEYIEFLIEYCSKFPQNTVGMAAHTFTYRVKK